MWRGQGLASLYVKTRMPFLMHWSLVDGQLLTVSVPDVVGEGGRRLSNRSSRIGLGESRRPRLGSCPFDIPRQGKNPRAAHKLYRPRATLLQHSHLTSPHHTRPHLLGDISPISHNGHLSSNVRSLWSHLRAPPANDSPSTNLVIILYVPSHARFLATRV